MWIEPMGPVFWGYAWLPLIFWVFLVALLIRAATGDNRPENYRTDREAGVTGTEADEPEVTESEAGAAVALGLFFWILLALRLMAVLVGLLT